MGVLMRLCWCFALMDIKCAQRFDDVLKVLAGVRQREEAAKRANVVWIFSWFCLYIGPNRLLAVAFSLRFVSCITLGFL